MIFTLTDNLIEELLNALENQDQSFYIDAEHGKLLPVCEDDEKEFVDGERYYELPKWNSMNGFQLRMDFVNSLRNPIAKDNLRGILHSGRGVFRNFKNELKNYPEVEKLWHLYKNKKMKLFIGDWYNGLREIWGLEKLEQIPDDGSEDNESLLHDDFVFREYCADIHKDIILHFSTMAGDFNAYCPNEVCQAVSDLWQKQFLSEEIQSGFVCSTLDEEIVGCVTVAPVSKRNENIVVLTSFYVSENYRGFGIGTELLNMCLSSLKSQQKEWILLCYTIIPDNLEALLLRSGFQKTGSGFLARIQ